MTPFSLYAVNFPENIKANRCSGSSGMLKAVQFRVQNFKNVEDSGWIPIENVTCFVGRNESGKTTLLKALHKFNPAIAEPYNAQREFPRDRFTKDFKNAKDWPVCSVTFEITGEVSSRCQAEIGEGKVPKTATYTRNYDGHLSTLVFDPPLKSEVINPSSLVDALNAAAKSARRLKASTPEEEEATAAVRTAVATWATGWVTKLAAVSDLKPKAELLQSLKAESEGKASPLTAELVEALQEVLLPLLEQAQKKLLFNRLHEILEPAIPVFIYFENFGVLDSAIYLPRFLQDLKERPNDPKIRTIQAMFKHVNLEAVELEKLGIEKTAVAKQQGQPVTPEMIAEDQQNKELRSVKLNAASLDISKRFSDWWQQRRHEIVYEADGNYFRIWVSDDRRPGVKIELESRSKGFQWFFSFYLVFLVESEDGHKNAILLLDEPGLNLHPTAQQELVSFFETLSKKNQILYSTHSPFLIDGQHIERVRPVTEDEHGHSNIAIGEWPKDRETIFPLQAAAGYAMLQALFQHKDNVLVEGMSDYYYLTALAFQCAKAGKPTLPEKIYITPCGGTKYVGHIASLFLGQKVRPVVLLDGDDAGRVRKDALMKALYSGHEKSVLMLSDTLKMTECEIEDVLGEAIVLPALNEVLGKKIALTDEDKKGAALPDRIKAAALRLKMDLPDGWKGATAVTLVAQWAKSDTALPSEVLERASTLFAEIASRFKKT